MPEHPLVQRAYDGLGPWARADDSGQLLAYLRELVNPLTLADDLVRDSDTHDGWGKLLDLDAAPSWVLPWLAQFMGVEILRGLDDESQRIRIRGAAGFSRGTPAAIVEAARQYLTGNRKVELYEREGTAWRFRLRTYASETPDPTAVKKAVEALKPAGVVLVYEVQAGIEINALSGTINSQPSTIDSNNNVVPS